MDLPVSLVQADQRQRAAKEGNNQNYRNSTKKYKEFLLPFRFHLKGNATAFVTVICYNTPITATGMSAAGGWTKGLKAVVSGGGTGTAPNVAWNGFSWKVRLFV